MKLYEKFYGGNIKKLLNYHRDIETIDVNNEEKILHWDFVSVSIDESSHMKDTESNFYRKIFLSFTLANKKKI